MKKKEEEEKDLSIDKALVLRYCPGITLTWAVKEGYPIKFGVERGKVKWINKT